MVTTLYMVRHGESEANLRGLFLGQKEKPLTERGWEQAERTADQLAAVRPAAIYSSDLSRARDTAEVTARRFGLPVRLEPGLREIDGGAWELIPFDEIGGLYPEEYRVWCEDIGRSACPGGESVEALRQRLIRTVTALAKRHPGEAICLFSHGGALRIFCGWVMGLDAAGLQALPYPSNASVTQVEFDGTEFKMIRYGGDDFMGELVTRLPENI